MKAAGIFTTGQSADDAISGMPDGQRPAWIYDFFHRGETWNCDSTIRRDVAMHVAHLMRKYNPAEWGGTETAVHRLLDGLRSNRVDPVVFCPATTDSPFHDPLRDAGYDVRCFNAVVPVWRISKEQKKLLLAVGGNVLSFDLPGKLWREQNVALIHAHSGNRLGAIAATIAELRRIPFVLSIHGGVLDLPDATREYLRKPLEGGIEWGKLFGFVVGSRKVLERADAIMTCNRKEAALQQEKFPEKRVVVQPHAVPVNDFARDCRESALQSWPQIRGRLLVLALGRIDPVKNQLWLVEQCPELLRRFPGAMLVLAGSCTDASYGKRVENKIQELGLGNDVLLTGGLAPSDRRLIGLFQQARVVVLPSLSETFGLVIIEAWAAGTPVVASRTSGALDLIADGENGFLFDLKNAPEFHDRVDRLLKDETFARRLGAAGREIAAAKFDTRVLGATVKRIYGELIEEKNALRHPARR